MRTSHEIGTTHDIRTGQGAGQFALAGVVAGLVAGIAMAMYAMLASATFLGQGVLTPLYAIASPLTGQRAMMASMRTWLYVSVGCIVLGLMIHMLWSAAYGVIFGVLARALHLAGVGVVVAGMLYGMVVLLLMSFVVLPVVGAGSMPGTVGWPSFTVEHLVFGMVLGAWPLVRPQDFGIVRHASAAATRR